MILYPECDERYPDWSLWPKESDGPPYDPIELTEAEFADYQRVVAEYAAWQKKISGKIYGPTPRT